MKIRDESHMRFNEQIKRTSSPGPHWNKQKCVKRDRRRTKIRLLNIAKEVKT